MPVCVCVCACVRACVHVCLFVWLQYTWMNCLKYDLMLLTVGPVFTTHPMNQEEVINNSFALECTAEGFPAPSIQWYHNNTMITNSSKRYIVDTTSMNNIASILRVIMADFTDSGVYHCEANSSVFVDNVNSDMVNISVVGEYGLRIYSYCNVVSSNAVVQCAAQEDSKLLLA